MASHFGFQFIVKALNFKRGLVERHEANKNQPKKKKKTKIKWIFIRYNLNKLLREFDHMLSFIVKISIRSINWSGVIPFRIDENILCTCNCERALFACLFSVQCSIWVRTKTFFTVKPQSSSWKLVKHLQRSDERSDSWLFTVHCSSLNASFDNDMQKKNLYLNQKNLEFSSLFCFLWLLRNDAKKSSLEMNNERRHREKKTISFFWCDF